MSKKTVNAIVKFFIPQKCPYCGDIVCEGKICNDCLSKLKYLQIEEKQRKITKTYKKLDFLDYFMAFYQYESIVKFALHKAKFNNPFFFLRRFLDDIPIDMNSFMLENNIDIIISVPSHKSKLYNREYDLPREMAKKISKNCGIALDKELVKKVKETKKQHKLTREKRKVNLIGVFSVQRQLTGENILIIDDIATTGHTLDELAKELKINGANRVIGVAFAHNITEHR